MKILLVGEYSNVHATLAEALRQLGHQVTVISNGDFFKDYPRDIDVTRKPGKLGGLRLMAKLYRLLPKLRDYDVVQLINPIFFELKAERLFWLYRYLRKHNKRVFLGAFGMDYYWTYACTFEKPLRYSDFNIGDEVRTDAEATHYQSDWLGTTKEKLNKMIAQDCDGIIAGLYEYWACYQLAFPQKTTFIPFPIRMPEHSTTDRADASRTIIFIGINRERSVYKGTDIMLRAAQDVLHQHPDKMQLVKVESVPFAEYKKLMEGSDAILDQLYGIDEISHRAMMGEYVIYNKGKVIGGIYDNRFLIKPTKSAKELLPDAPYEEPYPGAKEMLLITDPEDSELMEKLLNAVADELPAPKKRKK